MDAKNAGVQYRPRPGAPHIVEMSADGGQTWEHLHTFQDAQGAAHAMQLWQAHGDAGRQLLQKAVRA